ncbi:MAG: substrate-binding domain-containing protein [Candidatus Lokiarchaeota archaeon]|nr:substrate-binding domain-containing protein [Candidatus Lokiarchaeota archaeon]
MNNKRFTIGCFLGRVEEDYQHQVNKGISDFCKENDINLVYYSGRPLGIPNEFEALCNILFDFINVERIDGLIVFSGALCQFSTRERLEEILRKINLPKVSVSMLLENIPSIIIDNEKGMYKAVEHLIKIHNYKKIAFIKGPNGHPEAEERFLGYKKALNDNKIPLNQDLLISGDFLESSGTRAIHILFKERKVFVDAIIAANDDMAMGASTELDNFQKFIPNNIAVVGFDDLPKSKLINPPLTTVHQPLYEIGKKAAKTLIQILNKIPVKEEIILPTKLIIRRSCGCFSEIFNNSTLENIYSVNSSDLNFPKKEDVISIMQKSLGSYKELIEIKVLEELYSNFQLNLKEGDTQSFLIELEKNLKISSLKNDDLDYWNDVISEMRKIYIPYILTNKELLVSVENLFHKSRILIGETEKRIQTYKNYFDDRRNLSFLGCVEDFHLAHKIPRLIKIITQNIKYLGLRSCYLSLFEDPSDPYKNSKILLAFDDRGIIDLDKNEKVFPTSLLVPNKIIPSNRRYEWIIESLRSHEGKQYGFVILEPIEREDIKFGRISFHLSASLEESYLFEEREELLNELEKINENLEEFNFIVSHDLKTPLTATIGFLNLYLNKYNSELNSNAKELIDYAINNSYQMNRLIDDLLKYSCITQNKNYEEKINCNEIISEIMMNFKLIIEEKSVEIICDKLPVIRSQKIQIKQLFQNIIENSIKFHGEKNPIIEIKAKIENDKWLFSIQDNGIGIDPKDHDKIFKIFKRIHHKKEYPGTGIGLSICKKIVENHKGTIWIESELNKGTTFFFTLPSF